MSNLNLKGVMTALVTPFAEGKIDRVAYKNLIDRQIAAGVKLLVPCGTTGESATLTHDEHEELIDMTMNFAAGRAHVVAGAGSNATHEAVKLQKLCQKAGVAATLHITPYYNKPTQQGLYEHYKAIAEVCDLPVILYNVPGRTGVQMETEVILRLADVSGIVGIKEASGSLTKAADIMAQARPGFFLWSGEDELTFPLYALGAAGAISVTSNVVPELQVALYESFIQGKLSGAQQLHYQMRELNRVLFCETNPIPVKAALSMLGLIKEELRLPLTKMRREYRVRLLSVLKDLGLKAEDRGSA